MLHLFTLEQMLHPLPGIIHVRGKDHDPWHVWYDELGKCYYLTWYGIVKGKLALRELADTLYERLQACIIEVDSHVSSET